MPSVRKTRLGQKLLSARSQERLHAGTIKTNVARGMQRSVEKSPARNPHRIAERATAGKKAMYWRPAVTGAIRSLSAKATATTVGERM